LSTSWHVSWAIWCEGKLSRNLIRLMLVLPSNPVVPLLALLFPDRVFAESDREDYIYLLSSMGCWTEGRSNHLRWHSWLWSGSSKERKVTQVSFPLRRWGRTFSLSAVPYLHAKYSTGSFSLKELGRGQCCTALFLLTGCSSSLGGVKSDLPCRGVLGSAMLCSSLGKT